MAYGLGNFSDQLSAEELELAAARVRGGGPPAAVAPAAPPDMSVQRGTGAPVQRIARYGREDLADQNQLIRLAAEQGAARSTNAGERAKLYDEQAQRQRGYNQTARERGDEAHTRGEQKREKADKLIEDFKANMTPPSKSVGERVWGILGGVIGMASKNPNVSHGLNMITQLAGSDRAERWAREQHGRTQLYQLVSRGIDVENATEEQQYEVARRMGAADALYMDNAIESVKARGLSEDETRAAEALQLELRGKARGLLRNEAVTEQKQGAAAAKTRRESYFHSIPLAELRAMPDKVLGKDGHKVLADRIKDDQNDRGGDAKIAIDVAKAKGEQGPDAGQLVPGGRRVRDPGVYGLVEKPTLTKYVDGETKAGSAVRNIEELQQLVATHGTETLPGETKRKMQFLEKQIKLDLKDAGELGTWDRGSAEVLGEMIGDPTAWLGEGVEGVGTRLEEARAMIRYKTELRAKSLGLEYDRGSIGEIPKTDNDPRVRRGFVAPDAADRGVQRAPGKRAPFLLPQSNLSLDDIAAAERRVRAQQEGVPLAWMK